jgi:hypothetical protein
MMLLGGWCLRLGYCCSCCFHFHPFSLLMLLLQLLPLNIAAFPVSNFLLPLSRGFFVSKCFPLAYVQLAVVKMEDKATACVVLWSCWSVKKNLSIGLQFIPSRTCRNDWLKMEEQNKNEERARA